MTLTIPEFSLVVLIGPSGTGKSSFARKHFRETEVLSSDRCRALVSDDQNDQAATEEALATSATSAMRAPSCRTTVRGQ